MLFVPVVPACVLLGVLGGPLVRVVYGDRWSDAAAPLALLAVLGGARVALELAYDFLVSAGRSDTALRLNLLWLASLVPILIVAAHVGGITAVAAGHVIAVAVVVLPAHLVALHRLGVSSPRSIVGPITRPLVGGAVMGVAAWVGVWAVPGDLAAPRRRRGTPAVLVYARARRRCHCGGSTAGARRTSRRPVPRSAPGEQRRERHERSVRPRRMDQARRLVREEGASGVGARALTRLADRVAPPSQRLGVFRADVLAAAEVQAAGGPPARGAARRCRASR